MANQITSQILVEAHRIQIEHTEKYRAEAYKYMVGIRSLPRGYGEHPLVCIVAYQLQQ